MEVFGTGQLETTWSAADAVRFDAAGEFDSANAADLETGILGALQAQARSVDFDLTAVTFIDSTRPELLLRLQQRSDERHGRLRLYPNLDIRRLSEISGLDEFFELDNEADPSTKSGQPHPGARDAGVRTS
jgi:anti-anti-sigma factor